MSKASQLHCCFESLDNKHSTITWTEVLSNDMVCSVPCVRSSYIKALQPYASPGLNSNSTNMIQHGQIAIQQLQSPKMKNCQFRVSHRYSIFTTCKFSWTSTRFTFPINAILVLDIYVYNYQYLNIYPQNVWQITCNANTSTRPKFSYMFTNFPMTGSRTVSKAHVVQTFWYTQLFKTKRAGCFFP